MASVAYYLSNNWKSKIKTRINSGGKKKIQQLKRQLTNAVQKLQKRKIIQHPNQN